MVGGCNATSQSLHFEVNGGSNVSDIILEIGTKIEFPDNPTKAGFIFAGWYLDIELTTENTYSVMPKDETTLYAKWIEVVIEDDSSDYTYILLENNTYEITGYKGLNTTLHIPSIYLEKAISSIGEFAFYNINSIENVTIPSNIESIGYSAFYNCSNLENVTISDGVIEIGQNAFANCFKLTSIFIPSSVSHIEMDSFWNNKELTSITVDSENISYSSENGVLFNKQKSLLIVYPIGKTESTYEVSSTVTHLASSSFANCTNLIDIIIPSSVIGIEPSTFYNCNNLKTITVEDTNQQYASKDGVLFNKLKTTLIAYPKAKIDTNYVIPVSVTTLGPNAFENCNNLISVSIPLSVTSIDSLAFWNNNSLRSINVEDANQNYSSLVGVLFNKQRTTIIIYPKGKIETSYIIPSSVTSIGANAFANCVNLTSVVISSNVTSIGEVAFYNCTSLSSIIIPISVISTGSYLFEYCDNLLIFVEATSKPIGWDSAWNSHDLEVVWGYGS
jgi:uncharacterized repeat protein (TIGR02543 family)